MESRLDAGMFRLVDGLSPRERLEAMTANSNKPFTASLHPGIDNILGLRVPDIRNLAKEIASGDWRQYLKNRGNHYMEERMLHGMVLGQIKPTDVDEYLRLVADFVGEINSWSVCDTFSFAGKQRFVDRNRAAVEAFVNKYFDSNKEYEVRFAVVMRMTYFLGPDDWQATVDLLERVDHDGYYAKMAVAWALSVAAVKYPDEMASRLSDLDVDDTILRMTVRKIRESYRATPELKAFAADLLKKRKMP